MSNDTYELKKTITFPNMVVRVFSPIITDEEHNRRMKAIHKAAANLLNKN